MNYPYISQKKDPVDQELEDAYKWVEGAKKFIEYRELSEIHDDMLRLIENTRPYGPVYPNMDTLCEIYKKLKAFIHKEMVKKHRSLKDYKECFDQLGHSFELFFIIKKMIKIIYRRHNMFALHQLLLLSTLASTEVEEKKDVDDSEIVESFSPELRKHYRDKWLHGLYDEFLKSSPNEKEKKAMLSKMRQLCLSSFDLLRNSGKFPSLCEIEMFSMFETGEIADTREFDDHEMYYKFVIALFSAHELLKNVTRAHLDKFVFENKDTLDEIIEYYKKTTGKNTDLDKFIQVCEKELKSF